MAPNQEKFPDPDKLSNPDRFSDPDRESPACRSVVRMAGARPRPGKRVRINTETTPQRQAEFVPVQPDLPKAAEIRL
jgi:hypothetical protein